MDATSFLIELQNTILTIENFQEPENTPMVWGNAQGEMVLQLECFASLTPLHAPGAFWRRVWLDLCTRTKWFSVAVGDIRMITDGGNLLKITISHPVESATAAVKMAMLACKQDKSERKYEPVLGRRVRVRAVRKGLPEATRSPEITSRHS